ncbi:hypothetical protein COY90_05200, partial [Candidatus Roizmanbacteria bacterium CG_4_10_14_0_8_um_filter_39_9]
MKSNPKVSILCLAYNQERFIKQTLNSFFMQKTNFDFEVIIHDDASTDNTVTIIKKYQKKYPGKIKAVFQKENQFSKGVCNIMIKFLLPNAQGTYIALCEGDDYFTDQYKLQRQIDFLDKHPDYAVCFHPVKVFFENNKKRDSVFPKPSDHHANTIEELLKRNYIQTNSVMYRRQSYTALTKVNILPGDWYLHLYHAQFGKIGYINTIMAAYRRHSGGIWWSSYNHYDQLIKKHGIALMTMHFEVLKLYGENEKYKSIIYGNIEETFSQLILIDRKDNSSHLVQDAFRANPLLIDIYFDEILKKHEQNGKVISKELLH